MGDVLQNKSRQLLIKTDLKTAREVKKLQGSTWVTYFSALTAHLLMSSFGTIGVWPSSVIPKLLSNDTDINPLGAPCTSLQISIMTAVLFLAHILGSVFMDKLSDAVGRKKLMFYLSISIICCFCTLALAQHIYIYCVCLFVQGINMSGLIINISVYNSEVADDNNRTLLGGCLGSAVPAGILIGYIFGATFHTVKSLTLMCASPPVLHLLLSYFTVESPIHLIRNNRKDEAIRTLGKLRKYTDFTDIEVEYNLIAEFILKNKIKKPRFRDFFTTRSAKNGLFISFALCIAQQLSGATVIFIYMVPIFAEAGSTLSAYALSVLVGSVQICVLVMSVFIVNKFGRRPLILTSSLGCSIFMSLLTFYFYLKHIDSIVVNDIKWLPVLSIVLHVVVFDLGLAPIPVAATAELFNVDLRATGVALTTLVDASLITILSFSFPLLAEAYGIYSCMLFYSISTLFGFIVLFYILPETKGKSFAEIQDILNK